MASRDELTEFRGGVDEPPNGLDRRELMRLLSASVALAGLGACTQSPREKILPYARRLPEVTPGVARYYATSMELDGFAIGLLAKSHEGRPTKIEGNPEHPMSLGATGALEQASVLDLYDAARLRSPRLTGVPASWSQALASLDKPATWRPWFVLPPQSSPLVQSLITRILGRYPGAKFCYDSPLSRRAVYQGTRAVFGRALEPRYDFARARVTVSLDADFLAGMVMSVRWSRDFAERRRRHDDGEMARLYVIETMLTPTGGMADHRLAVVPTEVQQVAASMLRELSLLLPQGAERPPEVLLRSLPRAQGSPHADWINAVARDLARVPGASIVIPGDRAPAPLHVLAHAMNATLGNLGRTVTFGEPALIEPEGGYTLTELVAAVQAKTVDAVLILGGNPVYSAPRELELTRSLGDVAQTVHLTYIENETSRACQWMLPQTHFLESWGDTRACDGTISMIQPLIEPLYPARSLVEVLAACAGDGATRGHGLLTTYWRGRLGATFEASWDEHLKHGVVPGSATAPLLPEADWASAAPLLSAAAEALPPGGLELYFEPSPAVYDGRFANNAWLLELPHPMTKQTWGNAAVLSPRTAAAFGVSTGQVVELQAGGRKLEAPALILPGHADNAVTLSLGYGQSGPELLGRGVGVNAYAVRPLDASAARWIELRPTARKVSLAITQDFGSTRGRPLGLVASAARYAEHPEVTAHLRGAQPSLLPVFTTKPSGVQWAMTIDTTICTGCASCVVACQAENNVPVVGKEEVERGREMHWLRIDRYFSGPEESPSVVNQPMLCQHCEAAPCEYVCPVNATVHSPDGLNEMVYNRCIGTRFCSNNCPYKVRRFNWFEYTDNDSPSSLQRNPDVTVRERGVMEKCTYCVQRIRRAEMQARVEQRAIRPGEVVTACQQACPTQAIQFGALEHAGTPVVEWRKEGRAYAALHDLGTRPRTQYLAKIENPNPELLG